MSFQSCAAGLSNALQDNGASSGSQGLLLSICLIVAGIIGIVTRNSDGKGSPVTACVFYALGAVMTVGTGSTFGDLPIRGVISAAFAVVFLIASVKTGKN